MSKFRQPLSYMLRTGALPNRTAELYGFSPNTLRKYRRIALDKGLTSDQMDSMSDTELCSFLGQSQTSSAKIHPDWDAEVEYLQQGYNRSEAHLRYADTIPAVRALSYSAYCENLRKHQAKKDPVFRHVHVAARSQQTDYAGYRPTGLDGEGRPTKFNLFVCVLPYSHYIFANVTPTQSTTDYIFSHIAALEHFGGAPEITVTDNLKAAVIGFRTGRVPIINPRFLAFGEHYNIDIRPARVRTPTDKASVEIAVKLIQRLLRLRLNGRPLLPLTEINRLLREILDAVNNRVMKRAGGLSRNEKFRRFEKERLQALPAERLTFLDPPVSRRVAADYHVSYDNVFYSVNYTLINQEVSVRASDRVVEIRHDNTIVAIHARSYVEHGYVTLHQHRPTNHNSYLNDKIEDWATSQHPEIADWALACVPHKVNRRDKERILVRLRNAKRIFGQERLVKAIKRAKENDALTYRHVTEMLENGMEEIQLRPKKALPAPSENVRGAHYFSGGSHVE